MNNPFDGGHRQLFEAGCSGLTAAWRRAAENSVERLHNRATPPQARKKSGARATLMEATVRLVTGLSFITASTQSLVEQRSIKSTATAPPGEGVEPQAADHRDGPVRAQRP
jgi:hypothetical protein